MYQWRGFEWAARVYKPFPRDDLSDLVWAEIRKGSTPRECAEVLVH